MIDGWLIPKKCIGGFVFITAFFFGSCISTVHAQDLDSLLKELPKQKEDTNKVLLLEEIIYLSSYVDRNHQLYYIDAMMRTSRAIDDKRGIASAYGWYADFYLRLNRFADVDTCISRSLEYYAQINDLFGLAQIYAIQGSCYKLRGDYERALISMQNAYNCYEKQGSKQGQATIVGSMALLFMQMERYDEAEKYYLRSLEIRKEIGDKRGMAIALCGLGAINTSNFNYPKALAYLNLCLELEKELKDLSVITTAKANIARIYLEEGKYPVAMNLIIECYNNYGVLGDTVKMGTMKIYESIIRRRSGNPQQALLSMHEAIALVKKYDLDPSDLSDYYVEYYEVYQALGKYKEALENFKKATEYRNYNFSTETTNKILELKEKYETEKKEKENITLKDRQEIQELRLQQQRYFIYGLGGILILLLVIAVLFIRTTRIIAQHKNMQLEQRLLRSQMNPHFVFNALIAIQSYLFKSDPKSAGKFLSSFAKLMRGILENSREEYISVDKEIQWLKNYVELQKLRFENRFEYTIETDPSINLENMLIPPMLTQPFIENALEHGLSKKEEAGNLFIRFSLQGKELSIQVMDNGIGFDAQNSMEHFGKHRSLAIQITHERLKLLNKRKRKKIVFNITSELGKGTIVSFLIPVREK